jgi:hypothetical protein
MKQMHFLSEEMTIPTPFLLKNIITVSKFFTTLPRYRYKILTVRTTVLCFNLLIAKLAPAYDPIHLSQTESKSRKLRFAFSRSMANHPGLRFRSGYHAQQHGVFQHHYSKICYLTPPRAQHNLILFYLRSMILKLK